MRNEKKFAFIQVTGVLADEEREQITAFLEENLLNINFIFIDDRIKLLSKKEAVNALTQAAKQLKRIR